MRGATTAAIILFATIAPARAQPAELIAGRASVVDADTIDIAGMRVRFYGIDAPESWQRCKQSTRKAYRCGKEAAYALDSFLAAARPTTCRLIEREAGHEGKRWIGSCFRSDGADVNRWLVRNGWALDWPKYSGGQYAVDQARAKARGVGIWRGSFENPCVARAKRMKRVPNC